MLELRRFDVHKNIAALKIAMLDYLEIDIEVSDVGMELWNLMIAERYQEMIEMQWCVSHNTRGSKIFLQRWIELTYLPS